MRILQITHQFPPQHIGGVELITQHLAEDLGALGHAVTVLTRAPSENAATGYAVATLPEHPPSRRFTAAFSDGAALQHIERLLDTDVFDVAHIQHLIGFPLAAARLLRARGIPYVVTLHDFWFACANAQRVTNYDGTLCDGPQAGSCGRCVTARAGLSGLAGQALGSLLGPLMRNRNAQLRDILAAAARVTAPSQFVIDWFATQGCDTRSWQRVPYGIAGAPEARAPRRGAACRIAYVGGLAPQKGAHVLVEAFNALPVDATLTIAGPLDTHPEYVQRLRALATHPGVHFVGALPHAEVWRLLATTDVFVAPSLWPETFMLVLHEAIAAGCYALASDIGALPEAIRATAHGAVFAPGDIAQLRQQLLAYRPHNANHATDATQHPGLCARLRNAVSNAGQGDRAMNLLHVTAAYRPFIGGATTFVAEISQRLARAGHTVTVLTTDVKGIDLVWSPRGARVAAPFEVIEGVNVHRLRVNHLPLAPLSFYALRRFMPALGGVLPERMLRWIGGFVPRLAHPHRTLEAIAARHGPFDRVHLVNITLEAPLLAAAAYARRNNVPMICTPFVHVGAADVLRNYTMPHQLELMRQSRVVFVQTERERAALIALGIDAAKLRLLGIGLDLSAGDGADGARFRAAHAIPPDAPIVLFIGSITRDKGAVTLLRAMRAVWQAHPDARAVFIGDAPAPGGFAPALAELAHDERARVILPGIVSERDKHDALQACTLFAMPSRVDSFGIVYLEAWLHSKPVIGADAGGVPDVITHERDGLIIPFDDVATLARQVKALLADPARAATLGAHGRRTLETKYAWEMVMGRLEEGA